VTKERNLFDREGAGAIEVAWDIEQGKDAAHGKGTNRRC
jgi:hypothetical protein